MSQEKIEYLKKTFRPGMQIELLHMEGEDLMPKGLRGDVLVKKCRR